MTIHLLKIAYIPLKPILLSLTAIVLTFLQFDADGELVKTLGAGALAVVIFYMVIQLLKVIKSFNVVPQVVVPQAADPQLVAILNRLVEMLNRTVDIANANRATLGDLRTDSIIIKERQVPAETLRLIVNEELANSRAKLGVKI